MDYKKSIYTIFEKTKEPDEITKFVILDNKINEFDLFRIKESLYDVFISEALKIEIEKLNITGIRFIETMDLTTL